MGIENIMGMGITMGDSIVTTIFHRKNVALPKIEMVSIWHLTCKCMGKIGKPCWSIYTGGQ